MNRLPLGVAAAAANLIFDDLSENPQRVGKPLRAPFEGEHSARRGDYRIRYRIGDEAVTILAIDHRRDAYHS